MKAEEIKLKWQRHNQAHGMSWNEMAEFANEYAEAYFAEKLREENNRLEATGVVQAALPVLDVSNLVCSYREKYNRCLPGCGTDTCRFHPNNR
jgi:hypothetical protein